MTPKKGCDATPGCSVGTRGGSWPHGTPMLVCGLPIKKHGLCIGHLEHWRWFYGEQAKAGVRGAKARLKGLQ